jgi:hypothetical protein
MTINDGKGIFDKYGMLKEVQEKMEILADTKGTLRCGLIWDITQMMKAIETGLKKEDEAKAGEMEVLKRIINEREEKENGAV